MHWSEGSESFVPLARRVALPIILLVALALRLYRLGAANLWWDEALAVWAVRKGLGGVMLWTASDVHPPLFFWSLWAWVQAFGESEFALRLLPALFGVLTVAAVYLLGRLVGGELTGLLASLLTALSRFHVWWSQELRMYVLAGLLGVLSLYLFLRWLHTMRSDVPEKTRRTGNRLLAACSLATLGALYTIFLSGAWVLVENLVVLAILLVLKGYRRREVLVRWAVSQVAVGAILALWLWLSWGRMSTWSVSEPVSLGFVARLYAILLTSGASVDIDRYLWATILPLATALLGTILLLRRQLKASDPSGLVALATMLLSILIPPAIVYLSTMPRSLFYTPHIEARYLLPFAPAFWVLLAWAVTAIGRRWRVAGGVIALGILVSWLAVLPGHYTDRLLRDDYQTMVRAIASQSEPGDIVLLDSSSRYPLFLYQYDQLATEGRPPLHSIPQSGNTLSEQDVASWLEKNAGSYTRIWLAEVDVNLSDPDRVLRQALDEAYGLDWAEGYGHNTLLLFAPGEVSPSLADGYRPEQQGDSGASTWGLRGWEITVDRYTRGDLIWTTLYWDRGSAFECRLELLNEHDTLVASRAVGLALGAPARERVTLPVTAALPSGSYRVQLVNTDGNRVLLQRVRVSSQGDYAMPRGPAVPLKAAFAGGVTLEGYTLLGAGAGEPLLLHAGDELVLDLYWRATGSPERDWTVFTHLVGEAYNAATSGPVWGQQDGMPAEGHWPTSTWRSGETGIDRFIISIDPQAPPGDYTLSFGLYDGTTGERADIRMAGDLTADQLTAGTTIRITAP